ncbi:hypothetical protein V8C44DRAFT_169298 [Trichoderma aethiopicum]
MDVDTVNEVVDCVGRLFDHIPYAVCGTAALIYYGYRAYSPDHVSITCPEESKEAIRCWALAKGMTPLPDNPDGFSVRVADGRSCPVCIKFMKNGFEALEVVRVGPGQASMVTLPSIANTIARSYVFRLHSSSTDRQALYARYLAWTLKRMAEIPPSDPVQRLTPERARDIISRSFWIPFTLSYPETVPLFAAAGLEVQSDGSLKAWQQADDQGLPPPRPRARTSTSHYSLNSYNGGYSNYHYGSNGGSNYNYGNNYNHGNNNSAYAHGRNHSYGYGQNYGQTWNHNYNHNYNQNYGQNYHHNYGQNHGQNYGQNYDQNYGQHYGYGQGYNPDYDQQGYNHSFANNYNPAFSQSQTHHSYQDSDFSESENSTTPPSLRRVTKRLPNARPLMTSNISSPATSDSGFSQSAGMGPPQFFLAPPMMSPTSRMPPPPFAPFHRYNPSDSTPHIQPLGPPPRPRRTRSNRHESRPWI